MTKDYDKRLEELEESIKDIRFTLLMGRLIFTVGIFAMLCIKLGYV